MPFNSFNNFGHDAWCDGCDECEGDDGIYSPIPGVECAIDAFGNEYCWINLGQFDLA